MQGLTAMLGNQHLRTLSCLRGLAAATLLQRAGLDAGLCTVEAGHELSTLPVSLSDLFAQNPRRRPDFAKVVCQCHLIGTDVCSV